MNSLLLSVIVIVCVGAGLRWGAPAGGPFARVLIALATGPRVVNRN